MSNDDIKAELINDNKVSQTDFINFKIIIVGESGVGKSSLLKRAVQDKFDGSYQATIGFEFLLLHFKVNELKFKLQIWDTCGQEMYRSLVQGFYRNTSLALIVYDINDEKSYQNLDLWIKDIRKNTEQDIPIFVAGNKNDLERKVSTEDARVFTLSNRVKYFTECSAKTGQNVKEIFFEAARHLYKTYKEYNAQNNLPSTGKLKIGNDTNKALDSKKKKCC